MIVIRCQVFTIVFNVDNYSLLLYDCRKNSRLVSNIYTHQDYKVAFTESLIVTIL